MIRIAIAGGGAAGFFAAIAAARANRNCEVTLFERTSQFLSKVRISGGGRCNVTHALFDPRMFTTRYPRGERELISPFHRFSAAGYRRLVRVPRRSFETGRGRTNVSDDRLIGDDRKMSGRRSEERGRAALHAQRNRKRTRSRRRRFRFEIERWQFVCLRSIASRHRRRAQRGRRRDCPFVGPHHRTTRPVTFLASYQIDMVAIIARRFGKRRRSIRGKIARARRRSLSLTTESAAPPCFGFRPGARARSRDGLSFSAARKLDSRHMNDAALRAEFRSRRETQPNQARD